MASVESYESFPKLLDAEFDKRLARNPRYSLRAYARDLGLSPSRLSEIFSGAQISTHSAKKVCDRLGLDEAQTRHLVDLVTISVSKSALKRQGAEKRLKERAQLGEFKRVTSFETLLSKWYYLALIEYFTLPTPPDFEFIQTRLGLSEKEIRQALIVLEDQNAIEPDEDGRYRRVTHLVKVENEARTESIRRYHRDYLKHADQAVSVQPAQSRKFLTSLLTFSKDDLEAARTDLELYSASFLKKYGSNPKADLVFSFAIQFYELGAQDELTRN